MTDPRQGRAAERTLIIACGALARELLAVLAANRMDHVGVRCLPASLHNRPERIAAAVEAAIVEARSGGTRIFVAYADCGTGGALDRVLATHGVPRLPGPHCYAVFSGLARWEARAEADMRAFFLTDFLVRQFDTLVIEGLGLDRHPQLRDQYFAHYEKVVYLSQTADAALLRAAQAAARRLDLAFEHRHVGYGELETALEALAGGDGPRPQPTW